MVMSTTIAAGNNARIMLPKAVSLVQTDISGTANEVTINGTNMLTGARTFGTAWSQQFGGLLDLTVNLTGYYTVTADQVADLLTTWYITYPDQARNIQIDLPNDDVGSKRWTIPAKIETLNIGPISAGTTEPMKITATFKSHGTVAAPATIAT